MNIWHGTDDTPRSPRRVNPTENIVVTVGTWPIEPGQSVWVTWDVVAATIRSRGTTPHSTSCFEPICVVCTKRCRSKRPSPSRTAIVAHPVVWTFTHPIPKIRHRDQVSIRTNCPGRLTYQVDGGPQQSVALVPVDGVMAGTRRFQITLGPFPASARKLAFRCHCEHAGCQHHWPCCLSAPQAAPDLKQTVLDLARGVGVSAALDFVGADSTLALALVSARPAGRVVQIGLAGGTAHVAALKTVKPEVSVSVFWWGNVCELREVLALTESARLTLIPLEFRPLDRINDVYERVKRGQVPGGAVLTP
jgi:hypothetical protein